MLKFGSFRECMEHRLIAAAEAAGPDYCAAFGVPGKSGPCIRPDHIGSTGTCVPKRMTL